MASDSPSWNSIQSPWEDSHWASLVTCPSGGQLYAPEMGMCWLAGCETPASWKEGRTDYAGLWDPWVRDQGLQGVPRFGSWDMPTGFCLSS